MSTAGLTVQEANNIMATEPALVALLTDAFQDYTSPAVQVFTTADLDGVKESAQHVPAVHLVYRGYAVAEVMGQRARLRHTWLVIAAARNVGRVRSGAAARAQAGPLLATAMAAVMGKQLQGASTPLVPVQPPPAHYQAGYIYLPSAWSHESIFKVA
ncbi:MAG: hypothetical protein KF686_16065 [Ramlibacter sp.]|nr:hypothetical protein [Ramlibacter sp.]